MSSSDWCARRRPVVSVKRELHRRLKLAFPCLLALAFGLVLLESPSSYAQDSANFDDLSARASQARDSGDIPRAIQLYQQAVALNSKWQDGWWSLSLLQYQSNDYSAAQNSLTHFLELSPRAGPALALRGLCEFETGDYSQSLDDIQSGLALGAATGARNEQVLRYHAALLLTRAGSFQGALQQYTWFAEKGISSPDLFLGLGLAGLRSPKLPQEVPPDDKEMFTLAGSAIFQFMAHRQDQAAQAFQDFFRRYPKAANAHYVYGYLLIQADPDHAIQEFKRELEVSPSNAEANVMLAWTYLLLDEPAQALPFARSAFASQPSLSVSLLVLGRSLVGTGNLKDGAQYLEKAAQIDPNNLEIHIALAHVYSEEGRKVDSWRERQLCLQLENHGAGQSANQ